MKKELKDYIQFYIGCECKKLVRYDLNDREINNWVDGKILGIVNNTAHVFLKETRGVVLIGCESIETNLKNIKPILRPFSDVTDKEWNDIEQNSSIAPDAFGYYGIKDNFIIDSPNVRFSWTIVNETLIELRKRSIDVDGLIEAGLAIDKTTLK